MNLLTHYTHNVLDKEHFPCTFEGCSKLLQQKTGLKPMSSITLQQKLKCVTSAVALS